MQDQRETFVPTVAKQIVVGIPKEERLAQDIRDKIEALNKSLEDAAKAGMTVEIDAGRASGVGMQSRLVFSVKKIQTIRDW